MGVSGPGGHEGFQVDIPCVSRTSKKPTHGKPRNGLGR